MTPVVSKDEILALQAAWRSVPEDLLRILLNDLAWYCRANETCFDPDPRVHAALEGRREVWLRIRQYLDLTPDDLISKRTMRNNNG